MHQATCIVNVEFFVTHSLLLILTLLLVLSLYLSPSLLSLNVLSTTPPPLSLPPALSAAVLHAHPGHLPGRVSSSHLGLHIPGACECFSVSVSDWNQVTLLGRYVHIRTGWTYPIRHQSQI